MKRFKTTRRVDHSADDMFALVADVERYPEFLPLCRALKLRSREVVDRKEVLTADMTVAYRFFSETFTSRVTLDRVNKAILVEYLDGPFNHLENRWTFDDAGPGVCDVDFFIEYELRSAPLQMLLGSMFDQVFARFSEAFEKRADLVYGTRPTATQPA